MVVNDDAGRLTPRIVWAFFASMLAPTGDSVCLPLKKKPRKRGAIRGAAVML